MRTQRISVNLVVGVLTLTLAACGGGPTVAEPTQAAALPAETPTATTTAPTGLCANPLFPVVQGATWTYKLTGGPSGEFTYTDTITEVRENGFTVTSLFDFEPDDLTRTHEWRCTPEGLVALSYGGAGSIGLSTQDLSAEFITSNITGVTIPSNITPGMTWPYGLNVDGDMKLPDGRTATATGTLTLNFQEAGTESVTVPAGTFDATRIEMASNFNFTAAFEGVDIPMQITGTSTLWYAPGVGLVKSTETGNMGGAPVSSTTELQSYSIP
ncbi:MAG: hypothetical protein AB1649_28690 [Chloroflexota bacterium]